MSFFQTNLNVVSSNTNNKHGKIVFNSIKSKNTSFNSNSLPKKQQQHKRVFHIHKSNKQQQQQSTPSSSVVDINDKKEETLLTEDNNNNSVTNTNVHVNSLSDLATTNVHVSSQMIFLINKKTKRIDITNTNEPTNNDNGGKCNGNSNVMGNIRLTHPKNEIFIDDLKKKIKNTFYNQNALDLRLIKTYHQLLLEEKNQMYFSPTNSDNESNNNNDDDDNGNLNVNINNVQPNPISTSSSPPTEEEKTNTNTNTYTKYTIIMGLSKKVHCNCKKSNCLKNYCECKRNHERCDKKCECEQCKNINFNLTTE